MAYKTVDHFKKRFCQASVLAGVIAAPFTGGLSFIGAIGIGLASKKYNSALQSEDEYLDEKIYYTKKEVIDEFQKARERELRLHKRFKSIEDNVREGGVYVDD